MPKRKTHEEFVSDMKNFAPYIDILSEYKNRLSNVFIRDNRCGHEYISTPQRIYRESYCPYCNTYKDKNESKYLHKVNNLHKNIIIKSKYQGTKQPIDVYCTICNHTWTTRADSLLKSGCPLCSTKSRTKTHEEFILDCKKVQPNILIKSQYINSRKNVLCECLICHHEWESLPCNITSHGNGCPNCAGVLKRTHEEFIKKMTSINPDISFRSIYAGVDKNIDCHCKICNFDWTTRAGHLLDNTGCPNCRKSKGEEIITKFLLDNSIHFIGQKRFNNLLGLGGGKLSYDFYLPDYNLLIEYQGKQHEQAFDYFGGEKQFKIQQEHDKRKREYAKLHNIDLLEIWYYDMNNIDKILREKLNIKHLGNAS